MAVVYQKQIEEVLVVLLRIQSPVLEREHTQELSASKANSRQLVLHPDVELPDEESM